MASRGSKRVLYSNPDESGKVRYWYAQTLWRAAERAPKMEMPLDSIELLDQVVWFGGPKNREPTIRNVAEHVEDIAQADMSHPIIVVQGGEIIDGAHRIARAHIEGRKYIDAVVIDEYPEPDGVLAEGEVAPESPEAPAALPMKIVGPSLQRESEFEEILRSLPQWFGIEESLLMYVRDTSSFPTFAVEEASKLVGFISLREHFERSWEVHCIAVSASHRNRGIGTALLKYAEGWLVERGVCFLQIKTIASSSSDPNYAQTRSFYLACGYTPIEEFPGLWGPTNPALQLIRRIGAASATGGSP